MSAEGWAVTGPPEGIDVKTVSPTRRAAIVNWLVVTKEVSVSIGHSDDAIEKLWEYHRGNAHALRVRIEAIQ